MRVSKRAVPSRVLFVLCVASAALFASCVPAFADGVFLFSDHQPVGPGFTVSNGTVTVGVTADSANTINTAEAYNSIVLDGVTQAVSFWYPIGTWYDDGCSTWYEVSDYTVLQMSAGPLTLADGSHTVTARFRDQIGVTDQTTWSFVVFAPPVSSNLSPTGTSSSATPRISAKVTDNSATDPTVVMRVDGVVVPASWDAVNDVVSYTPTTPLANTASHTVSLEMTDVGGLTSSTSWSFVVDTSAAVTWSNRLPAPNAVLTNSTSQLLRVYASGGIGLVRTSGKLWLDEVLQGSVVLSQPNANTVIISKSVSGLADGLHTVRFEVTDVNGVSSTTNWSFTMAMPPSIASPTPASGTTVHDPRPPIGVTISDNMPGPLGVRLVVDGVTVLNQSCPQGIVRWQPTSDYANNSIHAVTATLTDAAGNQSQTGWTFTVAAAPPMSSGSDCVSCHTTYPAAHPMSNCTACHGYGEYHGVGTAPTPAGACLGCHDYDHGYGMIVGWQCTTCHSPSWPTVPVHNDAYVSSVHGTTACTQCHSTSLITEHAKYPSDSVFKYQCTICHATSNPAVNAAVAANDTRCEACHTSTNHLSLHESSPGSVQTFCLDCHTPNLVTEHITDRGFTCEVCHFDGAPSGLTSLMEPSPLEAPTTVSARTSSLDGGISVAYVDPADIEAALAAGNTDCLACHPDLHADVVIGGGNTYYPGYLSWGYVQANSLEDTTTPHGGYSTTTNKCAVCHSVHRATVSGKVLTAWPGLSGPADDPNYPYQSCVWCHATSSPLFANSQVSFGTQLSPHGYCGRCHGPSVHGADVSAYPVLAVKLIGDAGDAAIAAEIAGGLNDIGSVDFADPRDVGALTLGTGYLCGSCHDGAVAFPVAAPGAQPFNGDGTSRTTVTGHRVLAGVTANWNAAGEYGVYYSNGGAAQIAYNPTGSCKSCHDARLANGVEAFPHSYVTTQGVPATTADLGASYVWLTVASDADETRTVAAKTQSGSGDIAGTEDGLCLKCHVAGDGSAGVGITY